MTVRSTTRSSRSTLRSASGSAALALIAATLAIAGCGGSDNDDTPAPVPVPTPDTPQPPAPPPPGAISAANQCEAFPAAAAATSVTGSVASSVTNPQNRTLSFSLATQATRGTVTLAPNGTFTYTSTEKSRGFADSFGFTVSDGQGGTAQATYRVIYGKARIMPLGDSITEGVETFGNGDPGGPAEGLRVAYRAQLYQLLTQAGYQFDFVGRKQNGSAANLPDPDNEATGGFTTADVANGVITQALTAGNPDVVLVHLGTNEIHDLPVTTPTAGPMQNLLTSARNWATTNQQPVQAVVARIIKFREGTRHAQNVAVLNTAVTTMIGQNFATPGLLTVSQIDFERETIELTPAPADDTGLHPTRAGYDRMGQLWFNDLVTKKLVNTCN